MLFTIGLLRYLGKNDLLKRRHIRGLDPLGMHATATDTVPQANVWLDVQDGGLRSKMGRSAVCS